MSLPSQSRRFTIREAEDDALEVMDGDVVVCTCWQEPNFAHDIARLLNADQRAVEALREARDWIDSVGDFMARPMALLKRLDNALEQTA